MPTYNKLVRDRIPAVIEGQGKRCRTQTLSTSALKQALRDKLVEEVNEFLTAETVEAGLYELADVLEVVESLAKMSGMSLTELHRLQAEKRQQVGGFDCGIYLIDVDE